MKLASLLLFGDAKTPSAWKFWNKTFGLHIFKYQLNVHQFEKVS